MDMIKTAQRISDRDFLRCFFENERVGFVERMKLVISVVDLSQREDNKYIERMLIMKIKQKKYYSEICKSSDLVDIQKYINDVLELRGFNCQSAQDKMLLLTEEIGELAKAIRKSHTSMAVDYDKIQNYDTVESEVADVFIVLLSLCNVLKIDIYGAFIAKEKENTEREWNT